MPAPQQPQEETPGGLPGNAPDRIDQATRRLIQATAPEAEKVQAAVLLALSCPARDLWQRLRSDGFRQTLLAARFQSNAEALVCLRRALLVPASQARANLARALAPVPDPLLAHALGQCLHALEERIAHACADVSLAWPVSDTTPATQPAPAPDSASLARASWLAEMAKDPEAWPQLFAAPAPALVPCLVVGTIVQECFAQSCQAHVRARHGSPHGMAAMVDRILGRDPASRPPRPAR